MYERTHTIDLSLFAKPSITSWLFTSATVSETAANFASILGVRIVQNVPLGRYPAIKCNVSLRDGTKIYHLPFDQQYDRTLIEFKDECYVETVAEAESLGFRRAFRWRGSNTQKQSAYRTRSWKSNPGAASEFRSAEILRAHLFRRLVCC